MPGPGPAHPAEYRGFDYDGASVSLMPGFPFTPPQYTVYGGRLGSGDINDDFKWELITGAGRDPATSNSEVLAFDYDGTSLNQVVTFVPFTGPFGTNVGAGSLGY